ncbi:hypothetical protein Tco_0774818 [Tanacetum coccineum]|uniref:Uncharacterized protein n=1 Tax=Tanacetum coccineum TaxID=301880 RepID=A0ABQ4ZSS8_9ASTR
MHLYPQLREHGPQQTGNNRESAELGAPPPPSLSSSSSKGSHHHHQHHIIQVINLRASSSPPLRQQGSQHAPHRFLLRISSGSEQGTKPGEFLRVEASTGRCWSSMGASSSQKVTITRVLRLGSRHIVRGWWVYWLHGKSIVSVYDDSWYISIRYLLVGSPKDSPWSESMYTSYRVTADEEEDMTNRR